MVLMMIIRTCHSNNIHKTNINTIDKLKYFIWFKMINNNNNNLK